MKTMQGQQKELLVDDDNQLDYNRCFVILSIASHFVSLDERDNDIKYMVRMFSFE